MYENNLIIESNYKKYSIRYLFFCIFFFCLGVVVIIFDFFLYMEYHIILVSIIFTLSFLSLVYLGIPIKKIIISDKSLILHSMFFRKDNKWNIIDEFYYDAKQKIIAIRFINGNVVIRKFFPTKGGEKNRYIKHSENGIVNKLYINNTIPYYVTNKSTEDTYINLAIPSCIGIFLYGLYEFGIVIISVQVSIIINIIIFVIMLLFLNLYAFQPNYIRIDSNDIIVKWDYKKYMTAWLKINCIEFRKNHINIKYFNGKRKIILMKNYYQQNFLIINNGEYNTPVKFSDLRIFSIK